MLGLSILDIQLAKVSALVSVEWLFYLRDVILLVRICRQRNFKQNPTEDSMGYLLFLNELYMKHSLFSWKTFDTIPAGFLLYSKRTVLSFLLVAGQWKLLF